VLPEDEMFPRARLICAEIPRPGFNLRWTIISELRYNNDMKIEWDPKKARLNLRKHKVSFEEAATAMSDPVAATGADPDHSITEDRYITFGVSDRGRLLVVAHTEEDEANRIISARLASKGERKLYEEG
jgi:uncharacterized DUF497 family protein